MYISRDLFSSAYLHLKHHAHSTTPSVLILVALDIDSLCATRILTQLLKRDFIPHKIHPVAGYKDLSNVNSTLIKGNEDLRFVICLGLGGMVDLEEFLDLKKEDGSSVECWIIDSRRPWNLHNVFGGRGGVQEFEGNGVLVVGQAGRQGIAGAKVTGGRWNVGSRVGGVKCFDDGDVEEEMEGEGNAFNELLDMPEVDSDDDDSSDDSDEDEEKEEVALSGDGHGEEEDGVLRNVVNGNGRKRKSDDGLNGDSEEGNDIDEEEDRSRRRKTSNDDESPPATPRPHRHTLLSNRPSTLPLSSIPGSPLGRLSRQDSLLPSSSRPASPSLPPPLPSPHALRKQLRRLRHKYQRTITKYYSAGTWYGEPVSGIMYSLASDLGREDNDLLWLAIVGVSSGEIYGRGVSPSSGDISYLAREERIRGILRDEVRRLNPPELLSNNSAAPTNGIIQTTAASPNDTSIRISPEFRFMLIRHWSLYDSMLHSAYLGSKLRIWSETGRKKLHKLLAKMGFSLVQCKQQYTHMNMDLKRSLREKLEGVAGLYGIDEVVKEGFVRSWGWKACLSATDVAVVVGGILEVGGKNSGGKMYRGGELEDGASILAAGFKGLQEERLQEKKEERREEEEWLGRFYDAYDALDNIDSLLAALPTAMTLYRAIVRTGTSLIEKRQIRLLRAFRMAVVKEGPDVHLFTHPSALTKLAMWVGEAVYEQEKDENRKRHLPIVLAALNERRGVYVVVGMSSADRVKRKKPIDKAKEERKKQKEKEKEEKKKKKAASRDEGDEEEEEEEEEEEAEEEDDESSDDSDDEMIIEKGYGRNRFGIAFQEVANSTNARIRIDSFEACVIEVKRDDLPAFFESLSFKVVVG
ncbi:CDC45 family [Kalaharituber pfeilii]|nr:CDC45 family [Kalaharituber pfeilii]